MKKSPLPHQNISALREFLFKWRRQTSKQTSWCTREGADHQLWSREGGQRTHLGVRVGLRGRKGENVLLRLCSLNPALK